MSYEYFDSLSKKEQMRYMYYETMKAKKEEHERKKAQRQSKRR